MGYPKDLFVRTGAEKTEQRKVQQLRAKFDRLGRLSDSEKTQLEKSRLISTRATRRVFLGRAGAAIIGGVSVVGLGAAGLDLFGDSDKQPEENPTITTPNPEKSSTTELKGKERLLHEIDSLPSSRIKQLLQERVSPFFSQDPPFTGNFGDMKFPVNSVSVSESYDEFTDPLRVGATWTSRGGQPPEGFLLPDEMTFPFPLVDILSPMEIYNLPSSSKLPDGTPQFQVKILKGKPVYEGYSPEIVVSRASDSRIPNEKRQEILNAERFGFIKEACSFLLEGMMTELVYNKMTEYGLRTNIEAHSIKDGTAKNIDIVPHLAAIIREQNGRWLAGIDAASHIIAYKAVENTVMIDYLNSDELNKVAVASINSVHLGNSISEIVTSSFLWATNFLQNHKLQISGDITHLP